MRRARASSINLTAVALGLAFLYLPIVVLVVFSFNASRLVTVWGGWSGRWYVELLSNTAMLEAAWTSLLVGVTSATLATILGTCAAVALDRFRHNAGHIALSGTIYAPLVMPEVITGLSLLLLFVAVDLDRGFSTVVAAHATLSMCFVTVIVQSRLRTFDRNLEEAAADLGCPPFRVFLTVTLPLIAPAVLAGFMLAFTLSLDDFVLATFTAGAQTQTLPMRIYSEVRLGVKPEINAVCTLMLAVVAVAITLFSLASKRTAEAGSRAEDATGKG